MDERSDESPNEPRIRPPVVEYRGPKPVAPRITSSSVRIRQCGWVLGLLVFLVCFASQLPYPADNLLYLIILIGGVPVSLVLMVLVMLDIHRPDA